MKTQVRLFLSSCLLVLFFLSGCGLVEVEDTGPAVRPAKLVEIETASQERVLTFPAILEARSTAVLTFPVSGTLQEILVKAGDEIPEGTVIARLDPRVFQNQLATAQTQFNEAETEFLRAKRLIEADAISQSVFDQRQNLLNIAEATLDNARKALEDSELTAPFDGVVAIRHLDENQNVSAGQAIVTVQTMGAADVVFDVPSILVANSNFIEPIETILTLDINPDYKINTTPKEMSASADPTTQTFTIRHSFDPPEELLVLPGMTGSIEARVSISDKVFISSIVAPIAAVVSDGSSEYVWKVDRETMLVSRQDITTGRRVGETVIVSSGLGAGDLIVGAGASYLHPGMQVRPYNP